MPIGTIPRGCVPIYAQVAKDIVSELQLDFQHQQYTGSVRLSDIAIGNVTIAEQRVRKLTDKTVEVSVKIKAEISFKGDVDSALMMERYKGKKWFVFTDDDDSATDFNFFGYDTLVIERKWSIEVADGSQKVYDIEGVADLQAEVTPGAFDLFEMVQIYDIKLFGRVTNTILAPQIIFVRTKDQ